MKMKMKINNILHIENINRTRSRHGDKYSKYKKCFSMIMLICVKRHLSSIMKKLSNTEAELKKSVAYKKSVCLSYYVNSYSLNKLYSSL